MHLWNCSGNVTDHNSDVKKFLKFKQYAYVRLSWSEDTGRSLIRAFACGCTFGVRSKGKI